MFASTEQYLKENQPQWGDSSLMMVNINPDISLPNNFDFF